MPGSRGSVQFFLNPLSSWKNSDNLDYQPISFESYQNLIEQELNDATRTSASQSTGIVVNYQQHLKKSELSEIKVIIVWQVP
jgi:hypothetical protein